MSEEKNVMVARYRPSDFIVNYVSFNGDRKRYVWNGSKGERFDKKLIPQSVVDDLTMTDSLFSDGELVLLDEESEKILLEGIDDMEKYKNNTHSKQEIKEILGESLVSMKAKLKKIDVTEEKQFVVDIAREVKLDSKNKLKFLAEWLGVDEDLLFD